MSAMARRHRSEQRRLLGLRRVPVYHMTAGIGQEDTKMGGKPSKGTPKDGRLSTNKGAKKK